MAVAHRHRYTRDGDFDGAAEAAALDRVGFLDFRDGMCVADDFHGNSFLVSVASDAAFAESGRRVGWSCTSGAKQLGTARVATIETGALSGSWPISALLMETMFGGHRLHSSIVYALVINISLGNVRIPSGVCVAKAVNGLVVVSDYKQRT